MGKGNQRYPTHLHKLNYSPVTDAKTGLMISEEQIQELLMFVRRFITSISNSWENAIPERKRAIQKLAFPVGLRCDANGEFQILELPPLLRLISKSMQANSSMVPRIGIEPMT